MFPEPSSLHTPGFAHYSIAWSPFHANRLALASAANYGLIGNGRVHLVSLSPQNPPQSLGRPGGPLPSPHIEKFFPTQDGIYDVAWSEIHENQLVSASGDGSLRLWDVTLNDLPIRMWQEHTREALSVDWSNIRKDQFLSSSWDGTVKLWTPERPRSLTTLLAHQSCVYQAVFNPHQPDLVATCSSDGTIRLFDLRNPSFLPSKPAQPNASFPQPVAAAALTVPGSASEVLSIDWNKYRPYVIAAGGTDKKVSIWDCRMVKGVTAGAGGADVGPLVGGTRERELFGHEYAVRKVQWCPHRADVIASASYDMTCRVWTTNPPPNFPPLRHIHDAHTEFVVGCAWSIFDEGLLASCGWDSKMHLFPGLVCSWE